MKYIVFVLLVCCLVSSFSMATTVSYVTTTPIPATPTDWTGTLSFQQFNSSLGTLNSVQLDLDGSASTTLTIQNFSSSGSSSGNAKIELVITVQDTGLNLTVPGIDILGSAFSYNKLAKGSATSSGLLTQSGSSSNIYTSAVILSEFTGTGAISLDAGTQTFTVLTNTGGNTYASQDTNAQLTGTVIYDYTEPVPEPATIALLGFGSLVLLKRRKA
jgi:hypothetical protein